MPNWCQNNVAVSGPAKDIKKFSKWLNDGKGLLTKINPTPKALLGTAAGFHGDPEEQEKLEKKSAANKKKYGYANWYDWNVANWGTKWDIDAEIDDISSSDEEIIFGFNSAWSPPEAAFETMSEKFPNLSFRHAFMEEGVGFVGVNNYEAGETNKVSYNEDSNSEEWKEIASNEFGWEPWEDDEGEENER